MRRIVAVTRQAAIDAFGAAEALRDEFGTTRALADSALSGVLPALLEKLNVAVIPAAAKLELRQQLADLQAKSLESWKAAQKARADAAVASITATATEAEAAAVASGAPVFLVQLMDIGDDVKLATKVTSSVMKSCAHVGIMIVSTAEDKVIVVCSVPDGVIASSGVKANEWLSAAIGVVGGRGGGKEGSAQGQGVGAARVAEVIDAAKAFSARK